MCIMLNKQGDNIQTYHTPFPMEPVSCSTSVPNYCFLTCIEISQEAGQVAWYSHFFKNFPHFVVIHTVKVFGIVNKAEIDVFSNGYWQFDLWFLCLFKIQLEHLKFLVHILLKPCFENFEHYFASV